MIIIPDPSRTKPEAIFLDVRPLLETLAPESLSAEIHRILNTFGITDTKIVSVCTDGTPTITAAVKQLFDEKKHIQCLSHVLNSVVKDGLDDPTNPTLQHLVNEVESIVANCRNSEFFNDSQAKQLVQSLEKCYTETNRFLISLPYVVQASSMNSNLENVNVDLSLMTEINKLLALFEVAITEISANEQLTGSLVQPVISCIKSALQNINPVHEASKTLRKKLIASLTTRTKSHTTNPLLCQATLCDPRFQKLYLSSSTATQTVASCANDVKLHLRSLRRSSRISDENTSTSKDNPLWWKHDKNMSKGSFNSHVEADTSIVSEDEVKLYLGQELLPRNADPIKFWLQSRGCMPSLSYVALRSLTAIGSLVPPEVFVPSLETLMSFRNCRLTDDQLVERMFLNRMPDDVF